MRAIKIFFFFCFTYIMGAVLFGGIRFLLYYFFGYDFGYDTDFYWALVEGVAPIVLAIYFTWDMFYRNQKKTQNIKNRSYDDHDNAIMDEEPSPQLKQQSFLSCLTRKLDAIVLSIGGILVALRLLFPPKYYSFRGLKLPYDGSRNLAATVDYQTALLQSLGVAVITGVLVFLLRKRNKEIK